MQTRRLVVILLSLSMIVASSCRSRKTPEPQPAPPVEAAEPAPPPAEPVPTPEREFEALAPEPEVLSDDMNEATREAHERGWLRDAFFPFDASTLDADAEEALRQTATWLRANPEYRILIEGHCDERGTEQYNLALGDRRADIAASYLVTLGVDRSRIRTVSYGEERPFEEGSSEEAWAQNRRAHITLAGRR
ncbi:MAG: peptidoglycan-associated lipoprotein Pal [Thermoanaerobaculia bacterium]